MALKRQVLALLAIFVAVFAAENIEPTDIWDETSALMLQLNDIVRNAIRVGVQQNDALNTDITTHAANVSFYAQEQIAEGGATVKTQLAGLEILAEALGALECLYGTDIALKYATEKLIQDTNECIDEVANEALGIVNNITLTITYAELKVAGLSRALANCRDHDNDEDCVFMVRNEIHYALDELPTAIMDQALEALILTKDTERFIDNCADHRVGLIYTEGQRIIGEVQSCLTSVVIPGPGS